MATIRSIRMATTGTRLAGRGRSNRMAIGLVGTPFCPPFVSSLWPIEKAAVQPSLRLLSGGSLRTRRVSVGGDIPLQRLMSSSSAVTKTTTATSSSSSSSSSSWSWWKRFRGSFLAKALRFGRIVVVVGSVYALGYQRGLIDYGVDPVSVENSMLRSVLLPTAVNVVDDGTEGEDGEARQDPAPWYLRVMIASEPHPDKFYVWRATGDGADAMVQQRAQEQQEQDPQAYYRRLQQASQRQEQRDYEMMQRVTRTARRLISTAKKFTHQKLMDIRAERYHELVLLKQGNVTDAVRELVQQLRHNKKTNVSDWNAHMDSLLPYNRKHTADAKTDLRFTEMTPPTSDQTTTNGWSFWNWGRDAGSGSNKPQNAFGIHWTDAGVTEEELETVLQVDPDYQEWLDAHVRIHGRPFAPHLGISSAAADQTPSPPWKYILIDSPVSNAFVSEMVPRTIFVTTGLLETCVANDHEMALILGHELSHLILGHVSMSNTVEYILRTLEIVLLAIDPTEGVVSSLCVMGLLAACRSLIGLDFSRDCERQADELGLKLAALSCYDTLQGAQVFYKMLLEENGELQQPTTTDNKDTLAFSSTANAGAATATTTLTTTTAHSSSDKNPMALGSKRAKKEEEPSSTRTRSHVLNWMQTHPPTAERYAYLQKTAAEEENYHKYATNADHPHGSGCVATRKTLLQLLAASGGGGATTTP